MTNLNFLLIFTGITKCTDFISFVFVFFYLKFIILKLRMRSCECESVPCASA